MSKPEGFDDYWSDLRDDVESIEKDWERSTRSQIVHSRGRTWRIDWIRYSSIDDLVIQGWLAVPDDHLVNGAGFLWLPGYSYGTPPPDDSNLVEGAVTFAINIHGKAPDEPYVNPAGKNDYILSGIDNLRTYIYRSIAGHCLAAVDVLRQQSEVTAGVGVGGMSQGGGLAIIVAAQDSACGICCADMPFLADIETALKVSHSPAYRALKSRVDADPDVLQTVLLFDSLYHAPSIHVPTWLSAGGKDPACRPVTVRAVYDVIGIDFKTYHYFPQAGHNFQPEMNEAYKTLIEQHLLKK
jgi:cephalosporin-C deacetylase